MFLLTRKATAIFILCIILLVGHEIVSPKWCQKDQMDINLLRGITKGSYDAFLHCVSTSVGLFWYLVGTALTILSMGTVK